MRASSAGARPASRSTPDAASVTAIVGCACAAAASRKSRLSGGSARSRPWTRSCSDSGTGNGCPASTEMPRALQRANDLEGVERVPARRLVHLVEKRSRQHEARGVPGRRGAGRWRRAGRPRGRVKRSPGSAAAKLVARSSRVPAAARGATPTRSARSRRAANASAAGRRRVEPLDVVDRNDDGSLVGERAQRVQQRDTDRVRVRWRALVVLEHERARERPSLPPGSGSSASSSTGSSRSPMPANESAVSLSAGAPEDAERALLRVLDTGVPERRLPHARLAVEHKRHRALGDAGDEAVDRGELGVPSHDAGGHDPPIVRRPRDAQAAARYSVRGLHDLPAVRGRVGASRRRRAAGRSLGSRTR